MNEFRCHLCQRRMTPLIFSRDHFIPRSMGGSRRDLWKICIHCNAKKANRLPTPRECSIFSRVKGYCHK